MEARDIQQRITELRIKRGISELKMSRDLGHSDGYIHHICAGKSLPSMQEFLYICEYLGISLAAFFDEDIEEPILVQQVNAELRDMSEDDLLLLLQLIRRIKSNK